jgi:predicted Zn-dependent peptidase
VCIDLLQEKVFPGSPLGMSILGSRENIGSFKREDFMAFLQAKYTPQNCVIAIAGNIDEKAVLEKITAIFGQFTGESTAAQDVPAVYTPGFSVKEKDIEQAHLCMSFPGLASGTDESYALAAVNTILGGGMSSRLFQKIREQHGLVYSVYSYNASYADAGLFTIHAALNPDNLGAVMELISKEVQGMFTDKITHEQLKKSKEQIKSNFLLSLESAASRMNSIGRTMLMLNKTLTPDELVSKIDAISMDGFYHVCEKIFKMDQVSISLVGKGMKEDAVQVFGG